MVNLSQVKCPLSLITSNNDFIVVSQNLTYKYGSDNRPTTDVEGIRLELFDGKLLDRIVVKIPGKTELPFMQEDIEAQKVHISLVNATFSPYVTGNGQLGVSIKAEDFKDLSKVPTKG